VIIVIFHFSQVTIIFYFSQVTTFAKKLTHASRALWLLQFLSWGRYTTAGGLLFIF